MKALIGISIFDLQKEYGDRRALELARECGADAVDFFLREEPHRDGSLYARGEEAITAYYTELRAYAKELGLIISQTHGRCRSFIGDPTADTITVEKCRLDCLATAALGAPACVIHSVSTVGVGPDAQPQYVRELNHSMFMQILPFAKQYGVRIAAETFGDSPKHGCCDFFGNLEEFIGACQRIEATEYKDWFTVCIDTGHSNKAMRFNNPPPDEVIRRIGGDRISLLHLNDNDGMTDQHKLPLSGSIDWEKVFAALNEVGYKGVYNMELNLRHFGKELMVEHAAFAVKVLRTFLKNR